LSQLIGLWSRTPKRIGSNVTPLPDFGQPTRLQSLTPKQKLDLLKLPTRDMTEPGTRAAQIMRRQIGYSCFGCTLPHHKSDDLFGDFCAPYESALIHTSKDSPTGYTGGLRPDTPWCGVANKEQEGLPFGGIIRSKGPRK
jgi:hypothetical protein